MHTFFTGIGSMETINRLSTHMSKNVTILMNCLLPTIFIVAKLNVMKLFNTLFIIKNREIPIQLEMLKQEC